MAMLLLRSAARPTAGLRSAALVLRTPSASQAALACLITRPQHRVHTPSSACSSSFSTSSFLSSSSDDASHDATAPAASPTTSSSADIYTNNPILEPPWELRSLRAYEREAWEKYGPDMLDHLSSSGRQSSLRRATLRAESARKYERELGPNWYAIVTETSDMVRQIRLADGRTVQEAQEARRQELASIVDDLTAQKQTVLDEGGSQHASDTLTSQIRKVRKQKFADGRWPYDHEVYYRCLEEVKRKWGVSTGPASGSTSTSSLEPLSTPW